MTWTNTPPNLLDENGKLDGKKVQNYLWKMNDLLMLCFGNIGTDNFDSVTHNKVIDAATKDDVQKLTDINDYIVKNGTSGIWSYRKWSSGIAECWQKDITHVTGSTPSAVMGGYLSTITVTLPSGLFNNTPRTALMDAILGLGVSFATTYATSTTSLTANVLGNHNNNDVTVRGCHVIGTWK